MFFITIGAFAAMGLVAFNEIRAAVFVLALGCFLTGVGLWDKFTVVVN